ncbi:MAG: magnesium/cobalt transporter CorA [Flavobacteriales bacterium]|nr:magnesium/cobalt transporter CorA [Flavobacteriales bacterium]
MNLFKRIRPRKKVKINAGLPPGTIVFTGKQRVDDVSIHYLEFNEEELKEETCTPGEFIEFHRPMDKYLQWYDVRGLHDTDLIQNLGSTFKMHPLIQEDIVNTTQRPKYEEFEDGIFLCLRALSFDKEHLDLQYEQVSIFFHKHHVLSFQEQDEDLLINIRERIRASHGKVRTSDGDYLAYAIMDLITDHYFEVMEQIQDVLTELEDEISLSTSREIKGKILNMRTQLIRARKAIYPLREVINEFSRSDSPIIHQETVPYVRDSYDHVIQLMDMVETARESLTGIQDLYATEISFKMNKVMQFLAVVTTLFVPITFLAGLYGMNFVNIPELQHENGYFILLGVMALVTITLILYFKRKGWF